MNDVAAEHELFKACQVIFGAELNISRQFLEYVQLSGVKTAYRKRAKETHPDVLAGQGEFAIKRGARQFQSVKEAYESLKVYVAAREKGYCFVPMRPLRRTTAASSTPRRKTTTTPQQSASQRAKWQEWQRKRAEVARQQAALARARAAARDQERQKQRCRAQRARQQRRQATNKTTTLFQGNLPQRSMLFGHFLYYSGLVDWQTLVKALIWQRANRPRVGEIGLRFGWLSSTDVDGIMQSKQARDMFGQAAVDGGKLSKSQLRMILSFQKGQQKRIGEYFVRRRIFNRRKLVELLHLFQAHNARYNRFRRKAS